MRLLLLTILAAIFAACGVADAQVKAPHFERFALANLLWTPDPDAKLIFFRIVGGGGAGSGNQAANAISYDQYGFPGGPSGIGRISANVSISGDTVTWPGHQFVGNDPIYFDHPPAPFVAGQIYYVMADGSATANTFRLSATLYDIPLTTAVYAPRAQVAIVATSPGNCTGNGYMWVAFGGNGGGVVGDEANPGSYARADLPGPSGYVQSRGIEGSTGENLYADPGHAIQGGRGGGTPFGSGATGGTAGTNLTGVGGSGAYYVPGTSASGGSGAGAGSIEGWLVPDGNPIPILAGAGGVGGPGKNGGNAGGDGANGVVEIWQFYGDPAGAPPVTSGTWVPVLSATTTPGTQTYAAQAATWVRNGPLVTVWYRIALSALDPAAAGNAQIVGLPFAPTSVAGLNYPGSQSVVSAVSHTAGYGQFGIQATGAGAIAMQEYGDNLSGVPLPITNFHGNSIVSGSVTYQTSAP